MDDFADARADFGGDLGAGEHVLWSGRPRQGIFLRPGDALLIPFSLLWGGFAIFWELMALLMLLAPPTSGAPASVRWIFPLWGIPFVAVGLYLIGGRFIFDKAAREKTRYAVTNQRVIIRSSVLSPTTKSLNLRTLSDLSLTEQKEGRGTITFGPMHPLSLGGGAWPSWGRYAPPCFDSIEDAKRVFEIVRKAQSAA